MYDVGGVIYDVGCGCRVVCCVMRVGCDVWGVVCGLLYIVCGVWKLWCVRCGVWSMVRVVDVACMSRRVMPCCVPHSSISECSVPSSMGCGALSSLRSDGRKTNDRTDISPKGMWLKVHMAERKMTERIYGRKTIDRKTNDRQTLDRADIWLKGRLTEKCINPIKYQNERNMGNKQLVK